MKITIGKESCLTVAVAFLVAVVAILGYNMFQMNQELTAMAADSNASSKEFKFSTGPVDAQDPGADWNRIDEPFDINDWDPFQEMEHMQQKIDRLFGSAFGRFGQSPLFGNLVTEFTFSPDVDLQDMGDRYVVRVDIPGTEGTDIEVNLQDQELSIRASTKTDAAMEHTSGTMLRRERRMGTFQRQLHLPDPVDANSMTSNYEDGVLTVTIQKS